MEISTDLTLIYTKNKSFLSPSPSPSLYVFTAMLPFFIIFTLFPIFSLAQNVEQFQDCSTKLYSCGETIRWISYPFWGEDRPSYCGLPELQLTCQDDVTTLQIINTTFRVLNINQNTSRITIALNDLWQESGACSLRSHRSINNNSFEQTVFPYIPARFMLLHLQFSCVEDEDDPIPIRNRLNCSGDEGGRVNFFHNESIYLPREGCVSEIIVPVLRNPFDEFMENETTPLTEVLMEGFPIEYRVDSGGICSRCEGSGGTCWTNYTSSYEPSCLCSNGTITSSVQCPLPGSSSGIGLQRKLFIGGAGALFSMVLIFIIFFIRKPSLSNCIATFKRKTEDDKSVEAFIIRYGSLGMKRYNYVDIKKMTSSFHVKLGQGGFGTVFKGKLPDGRLVAVKVLNASKASGQEFINEVASIGRTSHVNIVALLGYCFDHKKRALIYEFMPNGSLEKFIYRHVPLRTREHLGLEKLYEVALGIARGLDYLHRGCNTCILHLDIKPHNILLDEDFCPKIADFGLAKLYSRKESIVSMLEARGTIGYIAPEVFNRNFGGVSHKSDVYSYGMLILEMVGGRKNVDVDVGSGHTSEIYFPYWVYNRLKKDEILLDGVASIEENDYARKMTIVGLWCIQANPMQRPSTSKVIEMLEGSVDELEMPPKPFLFSPSRSPITTSLEVNQDHCSSTET